MSYGFKLDIIFYNVSEKTNGKILLKVYRTQILEPVVKLWLLEGQNFVLKKNGKNGPEKVNNQDIVRVV